MAESLSQRDILVLENERGAWAPFLEKFFNDVPVTVHSCHKAADAIRALGPSSCPMVFAEPALLSMALIQKIKVRKQTDPRFRVYAINPGRGHGKEPFFDAAFPSEPVLADFVRQWTETLPMPGAVRLLVVDDEEEIAGMVRDYFGGRTAPLFELRHATDGKKGLAEVLKEKPDLIVLDIKMPVMDGREFYAELKRLKIEVPTVIFFDSISGEELREIRRHGNPPVLEKGTPASSLPILMQLVKKLVCFSG